MWDTGGSTSEFIIHDRGGGMTDDQIKTEARDFVSFLFRRGARGLIPIFFAWAQESGRPTEEQQRIWWECKRLIDEIMQQGEVK